MGNPMVLNTKNRQFTAVSLFSGCGGLDLGLTKAGFEILFANDIDPDACETYRKNIGHIHEGDIRKIEVPKIKNLDLLVAGFPCQPFSNAGKRLGEKDERSLFHETFRFIEALKPKIIMYENVRGLLSFKDSRGKLLIENISSELKKFGYAVEYKLLNFSHFGVPQNRLRVVLVATKQKSYLPFLYPAPHHIKDLSIQKTLKGLKKSTANQQELLRLNPQALHYGELIPEGGSWKDLAYKDLPERWKKIRDNMAHYHYPKFFRRHFRTDIMGTVTAAFKPENAAVWHPTEGRVYSVREIARFQTFPDDFVFYGRSVKSKYAQIGNAIPPLIGELFGENFKYCLNKVPVSNIPKPSLSIDALNVNKPLHLQELIHNVLIN